MADILIVNQSNQLLTSDMLTESNGLYNVLCTVQCPMYRTMSYVPYNVLCKTMLLTSNETDVIAAFN